MFKPYLDSKTGAVLYHDGNFNWSDPRWWAWVQPLRRSLEERWHISSETLRPWRNRILAHIATVQYLGGLLNSKYDFSQHDASKLYDQTEDWLQLEMTKHQKNGLVIYDADYFEGIINAETKEEHKNFMNHELMRALKYVILHHKITNPHHPEFYTIMPKNPYDWLQEKEYIDINLMPDSAIDEMVADWVAIEKESQITGMAGLGAKEFYEAKALPKYQYNKEQQNRIKNLFNMIDKKYNPELCAKIWQK